MGVGIDTTYRLDFLNNMFAGLLEGCAGMGRQAFSDLSILHKNIHMPAEQAERQGRLLPLKFLQHAMTP